jgi:addiction module RelB/DinJ family antitoxin
MYAKLGGFIVAQTNVSIRLDEDVKKEAEALFSKLGLTLSSATNIFFRQAIRTQGIPFPLTAVEINAKRQARKEFGEAFAAAQEQSVNNETNEISMDEIDGIIKECRQDANYTK